MEGKKNNPILNFRLENLQEATEDHRRSIISDIRNGTGDNQIYPAGSYVTLTREAIDSTESAG